MKNRFLHGTILIRHAQNPSDPADRQLCQRQWPHMTVNCPVLLLIDSKKAARIFSRLSGMSKAMQFMVIGFFMLVI